MRGISILELLIALLITSVGMICLISPVANGIIKNQTRIKEQSQAALTFSILKNILQTDITNLDRSRITPNPLIRDGTPTFSDLTAVTLSIPQKPGSQWWGFIRPYFMRPIVLESVTELNSQSLTTTVCSKDLKDIPFEISEAMAICDGGLQEVLLEPITAFNDSAVPPNRCWRARLRKQKNLIVREKNDWGLEFTIAVQLHEEKFLYYTSTTNELRRVQIRGGQVIENQPVLANIADHVSLQISLNPVPLMSLQQSNTNFSSILFRTLQPLSPAVVTADLLQYRVLK